MLGLYPGPDIGTRAAASLAGTAIEEVRDQISELARANLIVEQAGPDAASAEKRASAGGRISCHDLLRAYAAELAGHDDSGEPVHRLLDHYLHSAHAAAERLYPHRDPADLPAVAPGVVPEYPGTDDDAVAWVATERPALLAAIGQAAEGGFEGYSWGLAAALAEYLDRRGHWDEWVESQHTALRAATAVADLDGQAQAHCGLGRANFRLGRPDEAQSHFASSATW